MFFLATSDADGQPQSSYKGGNPGFVRVVDPSTLAFPLYDGNGMFLSAGNVTENPLVGLLFIDFSNGSRLRLNGAASIDPVGHSPRGLPRRQAGRTRASARRVPQLPEVRPHARSARSARSSCPSRARSRRCPTGSSTSGSTAPSRRATRHSTRPTPARRPIPRF